MGSGYKVDFFKADTLSGGRSEGRISPEAIKADRKGGGSKGQISKRLLRPTERVWGQKAEFQIFCRP